MWNQKKIKENFWGMVVKERERKSEKERESDRQKHGNTV